MKNIASFGDHSTGEKGTQIGQYYGLKRAGTVNYKEKTIDWTITLNQDKHPMKNIKVEDTFTEGQTLRPGSVEVKVGKNKYTDYTLSGEDTDSFTIELPVDHETSEIVIITYQSDYDPNTVGPNPKNTALVDWIPEGSTERMERKELKAGTGINWKSGNNHWKIGTYIPDKKTIKWELIVNYRGNGYGELIIKDVPKGNQKLVTDSIKVEELEVPSNGNEKKVADVENLNVAATENGFTLNLGETDKTYKVIYETTIEDVEHLDEKYENDVAVSDGTGEADKVSAAVTNDFKVTGENLKDEANQGGKESITIDRYDSSGGGGKAGFLIIDKVDKEGKKLKGAKFELRDNKTGKVLMSGVTDEKGQISFGRLMFDDYMLVETETPEGYVAKTDEHTILIDKEYTPGSDKVDFAKKIENYVPVFAINLLKTDNQGQVLQGAEFTLFDSEDNKITKKASDGDGKVSFTDLEKAGTYYVQETKAPAGYVPDSKKHKVVIGDKEEASKELKVKNIPRGAVVLEKIDADTKELLKGVEFELQRKSDSGEYEKVYTDTTNKDGQITDNTLEAGDYQFIETKPLDGYRENKTPIKFTVYVNRTSELKLDTIENEKSKGSVKLIKSDAATKSLLADAEFKLVDAEGKLVKGDLTTKDNGEFKVDDLLLGKYQLIETKAPTGYELEETPIDLIITGDEQVVEKSMTNNKITDISVEKKWNNAGGETVPVTVKLLPTDQTEELSEENDWKATFKDLRVYDKSGKQIDYKVEEVAVDGYKSIVTGDKEAGYIVTNTEVTTVSGEKTWLDDLDEHPSITVELSANGTKVEEIEVNAATDWKYEFTDLVKYDESGEEIIYEVEEFKLDGYESVVKETDKGFDITNLRVGETSVEGTKTWKDDNATDRPVQIEVNLLQNGREIATQEITNETGWKYNFTELAKYDKEGKKYTYTVKELAVDGYETIVNGFDITNLRVGITSVEGTKTWEDGNSEDRPSSIAVELLQNGEKIDEVDVTDETDWKYSFVGLNEFDKNGVAYVYAVAEQEVAGYTSKVDGYDITNTLIPVTPGPEDTDKPAEEEQVNGEDSGGVPVPSTATNTFNLIFIGFGLIVIGLVSFFIRRRKIA